MSKKGGKRPGAGRPAGSITKPRLSDYINEQEARVLIQKAKDMAEKGDSSMIKFILEQLFGKAIQPTDMNIVGDMQIFFDPIFNKKK